MSSRGKLVSVCWLIVSLLSTLAFGQISGPPKKGEAGGKVVQIPAPDFTLVDQDGRPFRLSGVRGKMVLVTFMYTTCPDVCPLVTAKLAEIQRLLKRANRDEYFLISMSTDPEVDTPEVLKAYAARFGADLQSWAFLTGSKAALREAWRGFGVRVRKRGPGQVQHTALTTLIDPQGIRRVNYFGDAWTERQMVEDIAGLIAGGEPQGSTPLPSRDRPTQ